MSIRIWTTKTQGSLLIFISKVWVGRRSRKSSRVNATSCQLVPTTSFEVYPTARGVRPAFRKCQVSPHHALLGVSSSASHSRKISISPREGNLNIELPHSLDFRASLAFKVWTLVIAVSIGLKNSLAKSE